jgi:hypothetical protein
VRCRLGVIIVVSRSVSLDPRATPGVHNERNDPTVLASDLHDREIGVAVMLQDLAYANRAREPNARTERTRACNVVALPVSMAPGPVCPSNILDLPVGTQDQFARPQLGPVPRAVSCAKVHTREPRCSRRRAPGDRASTSGQQHCHDHGTINSDDQSRRHERNLPFPRPHGSLILSASVGRRPTFVLRYAPPPAARDRSSAKSLARHRPQESCPYR